MDSASQVFEAGRIEKISKIMPNFSKVAQVGDTVLMGLEGDPAMPSFPDGRPTGTIVDVKSQGDDRIVTIDYSDGTRRTSSSFTIAPQEVWEFSDESFTNVLERERRQQEMAMRKEQAEQERQQRMYRAEESQYKAVDQDLHAQIAELRSELEAERQLTRNFHNTYIASLHELANDVCKLADKSGSMAQFCTTFNSEYNRMVSRSEDGVYRGTARDDEDDEQQEDDEQDSDDEQNFGMSDAESLSADEDFNGQSDYF